MGNQRATASHPFLSADRRRDASVVYAFCRFVDDAVDDAQDSEQARGRLAGIRDMLLEKVLPFPAMLLEAACASGYLAANAILELDGLRAEPIYRVPLRGLMAGAPPPPGRARTLAGRDADTDTTP